MLSILDRHCRYAHVGALRGDGVAPGILGMNKKSQHWFALVRYIVERILSCAPKPNLGLTALGTGQLRKVGS